MELNVYIGQKIKDFRKLAGMTQTDLAQRLETTKQTISRYEKGDRKPGQDTLFELTDIFKVSIDDFFPPTTPTTAPNSLIEQISDKVVQLHQDRQKNVLSYATEQLDEQERELHEDPLVEYRIYEKLSAGTGTAIYDDHSYDLAYFDKEIDHDIASWIYGDSMEPKYLNGDVALIKETGFDYDGAIYAVVWDGQTYIKKVYRENNGLRLVSLNNKYSDKIAPYDEDPRIIGKIIGSFTPVER
ncbi:TPA: S24 family peptidase [Streptococcus suis]